MSSCSSSVPYEEEVNMTKMIQATDVDLQKDLTVIEDQIKRISLTKHCDTAARKIKVLMEGYLDLVRIQQRLTLVRMDMRLSEIADCEQSIPEVATKSVQAIDLDYPGFGFTEPNHWLLQTAINTLQNLTPVTKKNEVIQFSKTVASIVKTLGDSDESYLEDEMFVNMIFIQFIDMFQAEWFEFLRSRDVEQVYLPVLVEFLNQTAISVEEEMKDN